MNEQVLGDPVQQALDRLTGFRDAPHVTKADLDRLRADFGRYRQWVRQHGRELELRVAQLEQRLRKLES